MGAGVDQATPLPQISRGNEGGGTMGGSFSSVLLSRGGGISYDT